MAAELVSEILKAENAARQNEEATKEKAGELVEYARKKADELFNKIVGDSEEKAKSIIDDANKEADEIMKMAQNMAKLRKKSVINETVKHYDEAIKQIIEIACGKS